MSFAFSAHGAGRRASPLLAKGNTDGPSCNSHPDLPLVGLGNPAVAGCGLGIRPIARLLFLTGGGSAFPAPQGREPFVAGERHIQAGLAILGAFARAVNTRQATVRIVYGQLAAISFQPRPFAANWNREYALSPGALADPTTDPLDLTSLRPMVSTGDMIRLAAKTAMAVAGMASNGAQADGTVTFAFATAPSSPPAVCVVYQPKDTSHSQPAHDEPLRHHQRNAGPAGHVYPHSSVD